MPAGRSGDAASESRAHRNAASVLPEPVGAITREWFASTFATPTTAQAQAWDAIADGDNTLVIAPTGSGKTLAAFLWALDSLAAS
ncbi:DEAD/DEAH box helicase, partial [Mycobacterium sp. E1319]|uniref:DEAD/DEAH box helicase n=1 Tax=Mycobacterium sp. E1319 TaxID=1834124 RepID=UPI0035166C9E